VSLVNSFVRADSSCFAKLPPPFITLFIILLHNLASLLELFYRRNSISSEPSIIVPSAEKSFAAKVQDRGGGRKVR